MNLTCQIESLLNLNRLAQSDSHSVLIEGTVGCGKTYLARKYAQMLCIDDFQIVSPNVKDLREAIDGCYRSEDRVVVCIENLDSGVVSAAYTILKFLEEPYDNTYIVVTCRNIQKIPDTIVSRSEVITASPPIKDDIFMYAKTRYESSYDKVYRRQDIIDCIRTFNDVDILCGLDEGKLDYILGLKNLNVTKAPVSNTVWSLSHFDDNTECPLDIVIKYVANQSDSNVIEQCAIECISDLSQNRLAKHQVLTKFVFDLKYLER